MATGYVPHALHGPSRRSIAAAVLHAIQWLRYSIGEFITESAVPSMCLQCYLWLPRWLVLSLCRFGAKLLLTASAWTIVSDAFGLSGGLVVLAPDWTICGFDAFNPNDVIAHHIAAGILGILGHEYCPDECSTLHVPNLYMGNPQSQCLVTT